MSKATLSGRQVGKFIELFADTPVDQVQELFASGLLADLRDAHIAEINRDSFRQVCGLKPSKTVSTKQVPLLSIVATTNLDAVGGKSTKKCFTGSRWAYRAGDFDNWLPANQPKADACVITTLAFSRDWIFAESAAAILGIGVGTDVALLGKLLVEHGHTMTLVQVEEMIEAMERKEETGMRVEGYGNFFFVETGDPKNPVSVGRVHRDERAWDAHVNSFGDGYRWLAGHRLLVRNLDALKLGLFGLLDH